MISHRIDWRKMISATKVRAYLLNDPLVDWLKEYHINNITDKPIKLKPDYNNNNNYYNNNTTNKKCDNYILNQGVEFEKQVMKILKNKFQVITINSNVRSVYNYNKTLEYMKKGYEIIYQGVLHDYDNNLYGSPDLLVRSDRINEIFEYNVYNQCDHNQKDYFYVIVDIKSSTLKFASNGVNLLNSGSIPAFKGQLYIYNKMLNNIQNVKYNKAFILGRRWTQTQCGNNYSGDNYMNVLATIDYDDYDSKYINLVNDAIKWIRYMRTEGHNWSLLPNPSNEYLYPNMKNHDDYYRLKKELDKNINELTSVWMISYNKRKIAHKKKVYSWKDRKCNSKLLEFKQGKTSKLLDKMLNINRQSVKIIDCEKLNYDELKKPSIYIDFETINSIGDNSEYIYMIGIYFKLNDKYQYKCFYMEDYDDELNNMNRFFNFVDNNFNEYHYNEYHYNEYHYIHWTHAEPSMYKRFCERHNYKREINFYDLHKLFIDNNIVIKGALNFSLKTVANCLYNYGKIQTNWDDSKYSNGLDSMFGAIEYYNDTSNKNIINEIIKYNRVDCVVMKEIVDYLIFLNK
jgi:hypothetical protein